MSQLPYLEALGVEAAQILFILAEAGTMGFIAGWLVHAWVTRRGDS